MTREEYAIKAEKVRARLVLITVTRGHDRDDAEDIVQRAIVDGLDYAGRFKDETNILRFLNNLIHVGSLYAHRRAFAQADHLVRIDDASEKDLSSESATVDPWDDTDLKLDVQRALRRLTEDDRELARLLFLEGMTYDQVFPLFADVFPSRDALFQYVTGNIKPLLRDVLAEYGRTPTPPVEPLRISTPVFTVFEQVFRDDHGYDLKPVTAQVQHHGVCREDAEILERRFREDELDSRHDWYNRDKRSWVMRSGLKHIGNRKRTRLFVVRKRVSA